MMIFKNISCNWRTLLRYNKSNIFLSRCCSVKVNRRKDQFLLLREKVLSHNGDFSTGFYKECREDVFKEGDRINPENFNALFLEACIQSKNFELGKQFFYHLYNENNKISLALIRKYFRLCFLSNKSCDNKDKQLLLSLYEKVIKDYPLLDDISCENLAMGLSITEKWREGIKLLDISKDLGKPTNHLYSSIIRAAFENNDHALGWQLLEEMVENEMAPQDIVYSSILGKLYDSSVYELFSFLEKHGLYLPSKIAALLKEFKSGTLTTISHKGICKNCNHKLLPITLNDDEFKKLTEDFLNPVLIGRNIFIKSKPTELEAFKQFLTNSPKADIVLDGLNIAFSGSKKSLSVLKCSKMLMDVTQFFKKQKLEVMVLGRAHMSRWPKTHMDYIKKNSSLFLAEDLSSDDSFLLYATMYHGLDTRFVSRDLMRGHKFLLKTTEMKKIFSKWQQKNQLFLSYVEDSGYVHFKDASKHLMVPQVYKNRWHIPIIEPCPPGVQPHIHALNMKWLCINLGNV